MFGKVLDSLLKSLAIVVLTLCLVGSPFLAPALAEETAEQLLEAETRLLAELEAQAKDVEEQGKAASSLAKASLKTSEHSKDKAEFAEFAFEEKQKEASPPTSVNTEPRPAVSAQLERENEGLSQRLAEQQKTLRGLQSDRQSLTANLQRTEGRVQSLIKELEESRNRLIVAETEVERLSRIIEARNLQHYAESTGRDLSSRRTSTVPGRNLPEKSAAADPDMLIATVTVDKANLRTGPGTDNSPLMTVARGTRLAVETRQGEWYRVISPTGARAWVSSDVISLGANAQSSPNRTVRIKGAGPDVEEEAFRFIQSHSR